MRSTHRRDGAALIVVLALLAVCSAILLQLLSSSLQHRFQLRRDLQREQTQWLLRAAMEHAEAQLNLPQDKLPEIIDIAVPRFESASISFMRDSGDLNPGTMTVSAQIGNQASPHQLTVLSAEIKTSNRKRVPIQE